MQLILTQKKLQSLSLTDIQAVQILRDIAELKKNTKDAELAAEFLETFSKIVGVDVGDAGEPNGVLANR